MDAEPLAGKPENRRIPMDPIAGFLRMADTQEGKAEGLTAQEWEELRSLRRECRILKEEKGIFPT
jgi:hypothetical protein